MAQAITEPQLRTALYARFSSLAEEAGWRSGPAKMLWAGELLGKRVSTLTTLATDELESLNHRAEAIVVAANDQEDTTNVSETNTNGTSNAAAAAPEKSNPGAEVVTVDGITCSRKAHVIRLKGLGQSDSQIATALKWNANSVHSVWFKHTNPTAGQSAEGTGSRASSARSKLNQTLAREGKLKEELAAITLALPKLREEADREAEQELEAAPDLVERMEARLAAQLEELNRLRAIMAKRAEKQANAQEAEEGAEEGATEEGAAAAEEPTKEPAKEPAAAGKGKGK